MIAVMVQIPLWAVFGPWASACIILAVFLGREIAQHEYKLLRAMGWRYGQHRPRMAWHAGLTGGWSADSLWDIGLPAVVCFVLSLGGTLLGAPGGVL